MTTAKRKIANSSAAKTVTATTASATVAATPVVSLSGAKVGSKAEAKPVPKKPAPKAVIKAKAEKPVKGKKPKLVRDSFTIPKAEYAVLDELKQRAGKLVHAAKKSELIRAGIKALSAMPDAAFLAALRAVPAIKTGRPSKV